MNPFALNDALAWVKAQDSQRVRDAAILISESKRHVEIGTAIAVSAPMDVGSVMACIRAHESGNYAESSHPGGGTGAYQYLGSTWRTWSARAGYPGYAYAYQAPAAVQDAVTAFTLTHGGSQNWSDRFGNDPCTAGLR